MKTSLHHPSLIRRTKIKLLLTILLFSLFSTAHSQLSGTYTIGTAQDYENFTEAVEALNLYGINGPVTFNIVSGTYTEQPVLNSISGTSETNSVIFQSQSGDSSSVILQFDDTEYENNYVLMIDGADFVTFKNLTFKAFGDDLYGRVIEMAGACHDITFTNNEFYGIEANDADAGRIIFMAKMEKSKANSYNITIDNNRFHKGGYAIYMQGDNTVYLSGSHISGNTFVETGYTSVFCNHNYAPVITYNTIEAGSYGIRVSGDHGGGTYSFNHINAGRRGMDIKRLGFTGGRALISNNLVSVGEHGVYGISIGNSVMTDVFYNSVYVNSNSVVSAAFYAASGVTSVTSVNIRNNNFANENGGYAVLVQTPGVITSMDHNNLYTAGNYIAAWDNEKIFDLYDLQVASGLNSSSLTVYPHYVADNDPHTVAPWLDNTGVAIPGIDVDFDGEPRHAETPDIGADEFTADPSTTTPLSGTYTIGSGGTYPSISSAFEDALMKGVSTGITFHLLDGTYNEQLVIRSIPGAGMDRRITLESQSGNPEDAIISYSNDDYYVNWVMQLHGADFITVQNLTVKAEGSSYARVIDLWQGADSVEIRGNILEGIISNGNNANYAVIYSGDSDYRSRRIMDNFLWKGTFGVFMRRDQNNYQYPTGVEITNNSITENGYAGIHLQFYDAPVITGNDINASTNGIMVLSCSNDLVINKNIIDIQYDIGIRLSTCYGTEEKKGLISNNFIHIGGNSGVEGIYINNSSNQQLLNNSVHLTNTAATSKAFYISSGGSSSVTILNNIFANTGGGYSYYVTTPATVVGSDYNDIYSSGGILAYWGTNAENLEALRAAGSMEEHSISIHPQFNSDTDLHTMAEALDSAGVSLAAVPDDIDGDPRHLLYPDIGADEFSFIPNNPPIIVKPIPDMVIVQENIQIEVALLDTVFADPDVGDQLTFTTACLNADITPVIENNILKLSTTPDYIGSGEVLVKATDLSGAYIRDTLIVEFIPIPNHPPVAVNDTITTATEITIQPLLNDYDIDNDTLTIIEISTPNQGTASIMAGDTTILYTPVSFSPQYDTIQYIIHDDQGGMDTAYIYITLYRLMTEFTRMEYEIQHISHGSGRFGDYDNDGDLDILLTGWIGTNQDYITKIYEFDNDSYSDIEAGLRGLSSGTPEGAAWCDYDNDGDLDIVVSGSQDNNVDNQFTTLYSNTSEFFTDESAAAQITGLISGSVDWGDYNNDGRIDLVVSGTNDEGSLVSQIYKNFGPGPYGGPWALSNSEINLTGTRGGEASWVDFDSDGDLDIFICGYGLDPALLYRNDEGTFTPVTTGIKGVRHAAADWGDYDNDGDPDLVICGNSGEGYLSRIYRNDGRQDESTWNFTDINAGLTNVESGDAAWGDYDNDGDLDLIICGNTQMLQSITILYNNDEGDFTNSGLHFPSYGRSSIEWGDYDNDGDLDLLMTGYSPSEMGQRTLIYRNEADQLNIPPSPPTDLTSAIEEDHIMLSWTGSTDEETPLDGLSYNIRIGTSPGEDDVMTSMAHGSGTRKLAATGNARQSTFYAIYGLTEGTYYWSVQAIDHGFRGSNFVSDQTIVLTAINDKQIDSDAYKIAQIYPNPAVDHIILQFNSSIPADDYILKINSIAGKIMRKKMIHVHDASQKFSIRIDDLPGGIYIITLSGNEYIYKARFIKLG